MNKIVYSVFNELVEEELKEEDIDDILGLQELNMQPYVWRPYLEDEETFLQTKLKDYLYNEQKEKFSPLTECIFQEYENRYILVSYFSKFDKGDNLSNYTNIIITFFDGYKNESKIIKRKLSKYGNEPRQYARFKIMPNAIPEIFRNKFNKMGLFLNRINGSQLILTHRFLAMVCLISTNPRITPYIDCHHINYDTKVEIASKSSVLPIREDLHTKEFHPDNIKGSAKSKSNIAKGIMYSNLLQLKYFKVKPKKYATKVHENIFTILELYFIQGFSIADIKRYLEEYNSKSKLAYNTIKNIVEHFKQYTPVLTKENIEAIKNMQLS